MRRWLCTAIPILLIGLIRTVVLAVPADDQPSTANLTFTPAVVIYVAATGSDTNNGLSWPAAKKTVGAGLNAAQPGDQVWVAAGTYIECIALKSGVGLYGGFIGNETQLDQRNWVANATILNGNPSGSVVTAPPGATASTRIDGFTLRNGTGTLSGSNRCGGGIYCSSSSPAISNNTITGNSAWYGGAIYCASSSPAIVNNTITGNTASTDGASAGGGIFCDSSSPAISHNTIVGNSAWYGGGIACFSSSPAIFSNTIAGNSASGYGGGISYFSSALVVSNNTITGNTAGSGGGIYSDYSSSAAIANNTIMANLAVFGGGICCFSSSPTISNNIVAFNASGLDNSGGTPALRNNCVYNPAGADYSGVNAGAGDISVDPLFVNGQAGDYHLAPGSPCIDAGYNAAVPAGVIADFDGHARLMDDPSTPDCRWAPGNCGTAPIVDMGAQEYQPPPPALVARKLFYNNSWYDNNNQGVDALTGDKTDSAAIDNGATLYSVVYPAKAPLMVGGGTATFANYSGYTKGVNGLIYDVQAPASRDPQAGDFTFHDIGKAGTTLPGTQVTPDHFTIIEIATSPVRIVRVVLTFPDYAVKETWLQVDVATGFGAPAETHFWGNAAGDTNMGNSGVNILVGPSDDLAVRSHPTSALGRSVVADPFDINKSSLSDPADQLYIRANERMALNCVMLIAK